MYGKIQEVQRNATDSNPTVNIKYTYDGAGNRISKQVTTSSGNITYTWYTRDAQGNVMGTYKSAGTGGTLTSYSVDLSEQHLYGSSRLGIFNRSVNMKSAYTQEDIVSYYRGYKQYELSNHLGNVLVTITDKKTGVSTNGTTIDNYTADVSSANDYYPGGMDIFNRSYGLQGRYGFNGKERDKESSQYDYGFRIYDPRLVRFKSVDPLFQSYPWFTPFQFAGNMPVWAIDLDGLESFKVTQRSFAPWARFGDFFGAAQKSFVGDNRGFSLNESSSLWSSDKVTARLHSMAGFTLGKDGTNSQNTFHFSSITQGYPNFGVTGTKEDQGFAHPSGIELFKDNKLTLQVNGSDPLVSIAPDIDWKSQLQFNLENPTTLQVNGSIKGKGFPAYENFIEDAAGNKAFLHTFAAPDRLSLGKELLNPFYDYKTDVAFRFELDSKGNFTGKMWVGENGKMYYEKQKDGTLKQVFPVKWTETTIDQWNQQNLDKKPAPDYKPGENINPN